MSSIISVSNVSKQYRLGEVGTGSLQHDINRWWHTLRGKEDPYLQVGETNDRSSKGNSNWVWALRDINFDIQPGEVLGIIGRNGAGKSTLLKILSQITEPSKGRIEMHGRVASLLEVGTGFHPDLTGRENIFLNGAILGLTKKEIHSRFDEIVDFAGVERYIDTPVKRYSSGMYVRLGFSVAAHLDPEILIVDEVLAVGDADFQKKCLAKLKDVSANIGRTVLFVSHNVSAIKNLCTRAIVLNKGELIFDGTPDVGIDKYLLTEENLLHQVWNTGDFHNDLLEICEAKLIFNATHDTPLTTESLSITCNLISKKEITTKVVLILRTSANDVVFEVASQPYHLKQRAYRVEFVIPSNFLNAITYSVQFNFVSTDGNVLFYITDVLRFKPEENRHRNTYYHMVQGVVKPDLDSSIVEI